MTTTSRYSIAKNYVRIYDDIILNTVSTQVRSALPELDEYSRVFVYVCKPGKSPNSSGQTTADLTEDEKAARALTLKKARMEKAIAKWKSEGLIDNE